MPQITINISRSAYPELQRKSTEVGRVAGYELTRASKPIVNEMPKIVKNIKEEVVFTIITPVLKFTTCLMPTLRDNSEQIKKHITKIIDNIKQESHCKNEDMNAIIYGGAAYDSSNEFSENSCRIVDALEEACNMESIEPTIISGQYENNKELNSYVREKHLTFWGSIFDKIKLNPNATEDEIIQELDKHYEYIKIGPNCRFQFIDKLPHKTNHLVK